MDRRKFIQKGALAGSFLGLGGLGIHNAFAKAYLNSGTSKNNFPALPYSANYAPQIDIHNNFGENPLQQLEQLISLGYTAFEDSNIRKRSLVEQQIMAKFCERHTLSMGTFVAHKAYWTEPNLASGKKHYRDEFLEDIKASVEIANRFGAKYLTVLPGHMDVKKDLITQTENVVNSLKEAAAILEPHGMVMTIEPLDFKKERGLFLSQRSQAYEICKAVDSPSCKILIDISHHFKQDDEVLTGLDLLWDVIGYFRIGETLGQREMYVENILETIHDRGYLGMIGIDNVSNFKLNNQPII